MRIGFLGVGWIGRLRMQAALETGLITEAIVCEPAADMREKAVALAGNIVAVEDYAALLARRPDGVAIATPSAQHAAQAIDALNSGASVFCQKPIGRTAHEVAAVVAAARTADALFEADFCYRRTAGMIAIRDLVRRGELGRLFAADLVFHNAYGPDKDWFYDVAQSGGGCMTDLGVHLVDLAQWTFGEPLDVRDSRLFLRGARLPDGAAVAEDYAAATLEASTGAIVRIACSWRASAGRDAVIEARFLGSESGAAFRNVRGSFYDFVAERYQGTACERLVSSPDAWGGRAIQQWLRRLAAGARFDGEDCAQFVATARTLDAIYRRDGG